MSFVEKIVQYTGTPFVTEGKRNLIGQSRADLKNLLAGIGLESYRAAQLWQWIYHKGVTDFKAMTNIAKPVQALLIEHFTLERATISDEQCSQDGTRKWLIRLADGNEVETVYIPDDDRGTLCISSQVGCTLNCRFCHTGTQAWVRNLTAHDIVMQVMLARDALGAWGDQPEGRMLSNIVLMGMGEPLYNFDNVKTALHIIMDEGGISISKRRITLSTSGVVPMIPKCGHEIGVNLAISLHAVTNAIRDDIVPLNKKYPIEMLLDACRTYPTLSNARRITFEYVMLKGVNDSDADAKALVALLKGIPAKVNLIPFNPWPGAPYECSSNNRIRLFGDIVNAAGYASPVRTPRGRDILAACGQLKSTSQKLRRSLAI
jgi:23S rRNA (adenine2503-C2)-methyltransferase